ncbi:MAG: ion transporter [Alphaproteobacteria bacterium]|jgi:voltage-gated sodium channel|nr:ion transporter [Alphaproteobacteria bacterium]MDP7222199.1 ion transporter [Alphaproteobacteria bacterium]
MVRPVCLENKVLPGWRGKLAAFAESQKTTNFIAAIIILNAITLGLETSDQVMASYGAFLHLTDQIFIGIFVVEMLVKILAYRLSFFRAGWNVFDFVIVAVSLLPANSGWSIVRALRIFRVLRLMSIVPQMRRVIDALLHAIPGMTSIIAVLMIVFYVGAVLATKLFGMHDIPELDALFGTVGASMFTLFQLMTLEGWADQIAQPTMEYFPWAGAYFIPFIVVTSFAVLNLFIGIIVDAMHIVQNEDLEGESDEIRDVVLKDNKKLMAEIKTLRKEIKDLKTSMKNQQ